MAVIRLDNIISKCYGNKCIRCYNEEKDLMIDTTLFFVFTVYVFLNVFLVLKKSVQSLIILKCDDNKLTTTN